VRCVRLRYCGCRRAAALRPRSALAWACVRPFILRAAARRAVITTSIRDVRARGHAVWAVEPLNH
jgi:hypothetical protein